MLVAVVHQAFKLPTASDWVIFLLFCCGIVAVLVVTFRKLRKLLGRRRDRGTAKAKGVAPSNVMLTELPAGSSTPGPRITAYGSDNGFRFIEVVEPDVPLGATIAAEPAIARSTAPLLLDAPIEASARDETPCDEPSSTEPPASDPASSAHGVLRLDDPEPTGDGAVSLPIAPVAPEVRVLGPVEVVGWRTEPPTRRVVTEIASYLALHRDRPVSGDSLRAAIWADEDEAEASPKSLRNNISLLRQSLGQEFVPDAGKMGGYCLSSEVGCDWDRFRELVDKARHASRAPRSNGAGPPDKVIERSFLREALSLVRGAPFSGVWPGSYSWAWLELIVSPMEAAITFAAHRLSTLSLAADDPETATWAATRGLLVMPRDRSLWADHLHAAAAQGRDALERDFRAAQAVFGYEIGDLEALADQLRVRTRVQS